MISEEYPQDFGFIWMIVNLKILYRMGSTPVFDYMLVLLHIFIWMLLLTSPDSRQNEDASCTGEFGKWAVNVAEDCRQKGQLHA